MPALNLRMAPLAHPSLSCSTVKPMRKHSLHILGAHNLPTAVAVKKHGFACTTPVFGFNSTES